MYIVACDGCYVCVPDLAAVSIVYVLHLSNGLTPCTHNFCSPMTVCDMAHDLAVRHTHYPFDSL
jgi:hypothetical protein